MGWTIRKSINLGPFRINLSKSGVGYSVGGTGFRVGRNAKGADYKVITIPGTGIQNRTQTTSNPKRVKKDADPKQLPDSGNSGGVIGMIESIFK